MNLYTVNDHIGHWPVGAASVVVAPNEAEARRLLDAALTEAGLDPSVIPGTLVQMETDRPGVRILLDGNY